MSQCLVLHRCKDQGIVRQQAVELAKGGRKRRKVSFDRQNLDSKARNLVDRLPEACEFRYLGRMLSQTACDSGQRPAKNLRGL